MSKIVEIALKYEGYPSKVYTSPEEGNTPEGFDCSGYVQFVILASGISLPLSKDNKRVIRHSYEFFDKLGIFIHEPFLAPGNLVFCSRTGVRPSHIAIYLGDNKIIHSSPSSKRIERVKIEDISVLKTRPIRYEKHLGEQIYAFNPIGYKRINEASAGN